MEKTKSESSLSHDQPGPSLPDGLEVVVVQPDGTATRELFGFQLSGNRTMGVFVRGILGGIQPDKTGRLQVGDQLLQVDDMHLTGMTTDQVARIIRLSLEMHGYAKLTVAHQSGRSKGHAWRPATPLTGSFSDSNLAHEMAFKSRREHQPSVHKAEVHSPSEPSNYTKPQIPGPPRSNTHDALLMMINETEEDEDQPDMMSPNGETDSTSLQEDYHAPLPNIPARTEDDRMYFRAGKVSPTSISFKTKESRGIFSPKKNYRDDMDLLSTTPGLDIRQSKSNGEIPRQDDTFLAPNHQTLSTSAPLSTSGEEGKGFLHSSQRNSFLRKGDASTEEVPLVCFDQLSRSYTDELGHDNPVIKRTGSQSSQSSCSNKSSNGSQHLAWQCPVCLDGANRITKTKRRLMSTACGHVFCSRCVADILRQQKVCPTCRKAVRTTEIHPIFM